MYHTDAKLLIVYLKNYSTFGFLTVQLVYKPNVRVLRQIWTIIILAEYGISAYHNIFKILKLWTFTKIWKIPLK